MGKYFGTDGFRGEAGVVLNAEHAFKIGRFLGWYYGKGEKAKIVIGKDTRRSSYMFENALAAGITASGSDAYLLHVTTTPCVSYITRTEHFDCGVMISASHNPFHDNGIKLLNADGEKMDDAVQDEIEKYIDGDHEEIPFSKGDEIGCTIDYYSGRNRYIGYLTNIATNSFEDRKIALDCSNGSAWMIGPSVFNALGTKTYVINNAPDGVNINTACGSTHIEGLQKYVVDNHLDCGFAFDGDADRVISVDDKGMVRDGDYFLGVVSKYLKDNNKLKNNTLVITVMANLGLIKAAKQEKIKVVTSKVGDRYVYEDLIKHKAIIGGEQSGHIIFKQLLDTGDGLISALQLLNILTKENKSLSQMCGWIKKYPQVLINEKVLEKIPLEKLPQTTKLIKQVEKKLGDNGRILVRYSGTEKLLRVMLEGQDKKEIKKTAQNVVNAAKKEIEKTVKGK